jgi:hypothetical protein
MNKLRLALMFFHHKSDYFLPRLLEIEDFSLPSTKDSPLKWRKLSQEEKFNLIIKLIVNWYEGK